MGFLPISVSRVGEELCKTGYFASIVLGEVARWVAIAALLVGIAIMINNRFPLIRGQIAMGVAAGVLLLVIFGIRSVQ